MMESSERLKGHWKLVRAEGKLDTLRSFYLDIYPDGTLICSKEGMKSIEITRLRWRVEKHRFITEELSGVEEEKADFSFDHTGCLILRAPECMLWFRRTDTEQVGFGRYTIATPVKGRYRIKTGGS